MNYLTKKTLNSYRKYYLPPNGCISSLHIKLITAYLILKVLIAGVYIMNGPPTKGDRMKDMLEKNKKKRVNWKISLYFYPENFENRAKYTKNMKYLKSFPFS